MEPFRIATAHMPLLAIGADAASAACSTALPAKVIGMLITFD
jgi:hypothetical protein